MYGPKFERIGPCAINKCPSIPTIYIYEPYIWDDMEHHINKQYMCEKHADQFFISKGYLSIKEQEKNR